jgi:hypothetical protein
LLKEKVRNEKAGGHMLFRFFGGDKSKAHALCSPFFLYK